jgi:pimeloyl-ACP methyl ester carboxylesterase
VPVGAGSLHIERYGLGGPAVLLIHGFATNSFVWRNVGPAVALANLTAFAVDMLGYGASDRPPESDYGIAAQAEYLDRALTALRLAKATVVGLDLGAAVALRLAASHPDRVERLVLVNPVAADAMPPEDIRSLQRNTARFAFRVSSGVLGAAPLLRDLLQKSVSDPSHMPEPLVARFLAPYVGQRGLDQLLKAARFVNREDVDEINLRALPHPTLVVRGEKDPWVGPEVSEYLSHTIGGSRLVRIASASRLVPEDVPEVFTNLLLDFIGARAVGGTV